MRVMANVIASGNGQRISLSFAVAHLVIICLWVIFSDLVPGHSPCSKWQRFAWTSCVALIA